MFYQTKDLVDSSFPASKPGKEENENKPFSFPRYINEKIKIIDLLKTNITEDSYIRFIENEKNECLDKSIHFQNYEPLKYCFDKLYTENEKHSENILNIRGNDCHTTFIDYINDIEKKEEVYTLKLENIIEDGRTTCMIKNIPNKFTADNLIEFINYTHFGKYDFLYLRMDFKNKCNVGYAFVNFVDTASVKSFFLRINGKRWCSMGSSKIA